MERDKYECRQCRGTETMLWPEAASGKMMPHEVRFKDSVRRIDQWFMENGTLQSFPIFHPADIFLTPTPKHRRMHVHHRLYIYNRLPWHYNDEQLITMCERCHFNWHQKHRVKVYVETAVGLVEKDELTPCVRCSGAGRFPEYNHIEAGICFRCSGACFEEWVKPSRKQRTKMS